ncbi:universal stress protein [Streptomyces sp. HNM0574]|uniref:universal stress protein n=1 Tax=Streptomyces sp. HNM0574 TaxID=2714954 RepID=UPI00146A220E|nr:universal stress protein [Streptomyces sp. HNM0574]NLU70345.1 universal stress protein [Streptomyces sp. HNM0574]
MTTAETPNGGRVLMAADGSEADAATAALAAHEARLRSWALHVVHVLPWPIAASIRTTLPPPSSALHQHAEQIVTDAAHHATTAQPEVPLSREVIVGQPFTDLTAQAHQADLTVLGSSGRGALGSAVESVAVYLSANTTCPILVQRGRHQPDGPVLLATDGSPDSHAATDFAFTEAALRNAPLLALHIAAPRPGPAPAGMNAMDTLLFEDPPDPDDTDAQHATEQALAAHRERHPHLDVTVRTQRGRVRPELIDASNHAQLLVLGARGRGGFAGLLLGSVSQALLQHAHCPLTVIRHDHTTTQQT